MERRRRALLLLLLPLLLLAAAAPGRVRAQYEAYSFRGFPAGALEPLQSAYAAALDLYEGERWKESVGALEAALRLHRLLRDSEAHCHKECAAAAEEEPEPPPEPGPGAAAAEWLAEMELFGRVLRRASCLRRCKRGLPAFQLPYPPADTLRDFQRRAPYLYLHYALYKPACLELISSTTSVILSPNPPEQASALPFRLLDLSVL